MVIVELIDSHSGFKIITGRITTRSKSKLLLIVVTITFLLSALLDNLTTSIVMSSLLLKLLDEKKDRLWFCGMQNFAESCTHNQVAQPKVNTQNVKKG